MKTADVGVAIVLYTVGLAIWAVLVALWISLDRTVPPLAWVVLTPVLLVLYGLAQMFFDAAFPAKVDDHVPEKELSFLRIGRAFLSILPTLVVTLIVVWVMKGM